MLVLLISAALALLTLLVYCPSFDCPFVNFDDPAYVTYNPQVQAGLTADSIRWAFTTFACVNWHPLTWLSLQLDAELSGGQNASGFHRTNVLLHTANTLLLFWVLWRMTGMVWRSAVVAALFGLHPLHVESVAWVAERKDVLSTLFWMLSLAAYLGYVRRPSMGRYLLVLLALTLGLLAKPMLVTLPLVLLLLDYWPLCRFDLSHGRKKSGRVALRQLLLEKAPMFALVAVSCVFTILAQQSGRAVAEFEIIPLHARIWNAFLAYVGYVGQMVWPQHLAVYYPHAAGSVSVLQALGAAFLLLLITGLVLGPGRRWPYLAVGWLWYLGTLIPVIGLVQVGEQAMADRYTYVPLIGLFLLITWGVSDLAATWRLPRLLPMATSVVVLLACIVLTWDQLTYWRESVPLWQHTIEVTEKNAMAQFNLARALSDQGLLSEAEAHYRKAVEIDPQFFSAQVELGNFLQSQGRPDEAVTVYRQAMRGYRRASERDPQFAPYHTNLGAALHGLGRQEEALDEYRKVVELDPTNVPAYYNLGKLLGDLGRPQEALKVYRRSIELDPQTAMPHNALGIVLQQLGRPEEAIREFQEALSLQHDYAEAYYNLGQVLLREGRFTMALTNLERGHELGSRSPRWPYPSDKWVAQARRLIALESRLPSFLKGEAQPADVDECLVLALLCRCKRRYDSAARFYAVAFAKEPRLADDPRAGHGYEAACAAALASRGHGEAVPNAEDPERARLRRQAHDWLQSDLDYWTRLAQSGKAKDRALAKQALQRWQTGTDLAGVRDQDTLEQLPPEERTAWAQLWQNVQAVLAEVQAGSSGS
jgi:tetratricopeptide (TPR) repeat protein